MPASMRYEGFSGVVSLYDGDRAVEQVCEGFSDFAGELPNGPCTRFGMASGSKAFTAAAALRLVEAGALGLDDAARELAGDGRIDGAITVRQLLAHSSGLADYFDEETMDDYEELWRERPNYRMRRPADFLGLFLGRPASFAAGERFAYSNSGYVLLAYIIERITRRSFPDFAGEEVFAPCGMASTGYFSLDAPLKGMAAGCIGEGKERRSNIYSIPPIGGGDGGCFTNGEDMNRFWRSLAGGALLGPGLAGQMLSVQAAETGEGDRYGLGVWIDARDEDIAFVQGFDPGVRFLSYLRRSTGRTLTIAANVECRLRPIAADFKPLL